MSLDCFTDDPGVDLRLVFGKHEGAGFLLGRAHPADEWGALCGLNWDPRDTDVACRHLGFHAGAMTIDTRAEDAPGLPGAPTFLSSVGCHGNESDVSQCDLVSVRDMPCASFPYIECITGSRG